MPFERRFHPLPSTFAFGWFAFLSFAPTCRLSLLGLGAQIPALFHANFGCLTRRSRQATFMFHWCFPTGAAQTTSWFRSCLSQTGSKPSLSFAKVRFSPCAYAQARIAASVGFHGQARILRRSNSLSDFQHESKSGVSKAVEFLLQIGAATSCELLAHLFFVRLSA